MLARGLFEGERPRFEAEVLKMAANTQTISGFGGGVFLWEVEALLKVVVL